MYYYAFHILNSYPNWQNDISTGPVVLLAGHLRQNFFEEKSSTGLLII